MNRQERRRLEKEEKKKTMQLDAGNENGNKLMVKFVCQQCDVEEDIPEEIVNYCDMMDDGDITCIIYYCKKVDLEIK